MKGRLSLVGGRLLLGAFLTPDAVRPPDEVYLALTGKLATDGDTGASLVEPDVSAGYTRPAYPTGQRWWSTSGYGTFWNTEEIVFPPAQEIWSRTRSWALVSAPVSGDVLAMGSTTMGNIPAGVQLVVAPGSLQLVVRGAPL